MSTWKEKDEAYKRRPTRVFLAARMTQSCGHLNHESMKRIRGAMIDAFTQAAEREGLASTWTLDLSTKTPKDFDALLSRRQMLLAEPPSVDVDGGHVESPEAAVPSKPESTNASKNSDGGHPEGTAA